MEKEVYRVKPIVIYPECILKTGKQNDCRKCAKLSTCKSPRSMCVRPYKGNPNGCPNFGKLKTCPPNIPCMYDQMFDTTEVYAVATKFDKEAFFEQRRVKRPDLPEGQIENSRVWQPITKKENDWAIAEYCRANPEMSDYVSTRLLECMGVQVVDTMKDVGLQLKFPPGRFVYRISFLAKAYKEALERFEFEVKEERDKMKRGMKSLVLKR